MESRQRSTTDARSLLRKSGARGGRQEARGTVETPPTGIWHTPPVGWLTFSELEAQAARVDDLAARTPAIDAFCSSSAWTFPARRAFAPDAEPFVFDAGDCIVALMVVESGNGARVAVPLEAGWGLAAPLLGADPEQAVATLRHMVAARPDGLAGVFLSGLSRHAEVWRRLVRGFARDCRLGLGPSCPRRNASLAGGLDGFLGRRSARFRANLRRAWRQAADAGVRFERATGEDDPAALYARIQAVEQRSWKGRAGEGIDHGSPRHFYDIMVHHLAGRGSLRAVFARRDGEDLAYVFGGVLADTYRGLQVSYAQSHAEHSPGNLVQLAMIEWLCEEGVGWYDLGTDMPYKKRWAEEGLETHTLALLPLD